MHPKYERLRMLGAALEAAVQVLDDPITRVEVKGGRVFVWAGPKQVTQRPIPGQAAKLLEAVVFRWRLARPREPVGC